MSSIQVETKMIRYELIKRLRSAEERKTKMVEKTSVANEKGDWQSIQKMEEYIIELKRQIENL